MSTANVFNEEGRLLQIEYAIKNVSKAGTIIGVVCTNGIVLIGINKEDIPENDGRREKIYPITDKIYVALCGLFGDAMLLKKYAQIKAQDILEKYDQEASLSCVVKEVSKKKQLFTQYAQTRPFGVSFIYAGMEDDEFLIYSTDPSGTINQWKGVAYGENEDGINKGLKDLLIKDMESTTLEIIKILSKVVECGVKESKKFEILHYGDTEVKYLSHEEIKKILEEIENK
ncbi:Proteasome component Y13 [Nosema bombycis CQ1]|uniref:Proteasome component Y13 n=1 Tax=Nosema bombycis (strain CQ1 / CVCC 102059) TaxID=578461 RepID=R0KT27_NOSB1|nr:Proteasome component Y13 [Nosema bombycis CQ1]|eukprot:EOB13931.1 Proteasome component Y13 [Nosema bombycis CQ1]